MGTLTEVQIRNWIRKLTPIAKSDGNGLTFTLSSNGTAAWILRYYITGKRKEISLGRYPDVSLGEARQIASQKRAQVQQGVDVAREKQKTKQEANRLWTFERLTGNYLDMAAEHLSANTIAGRRQQLRDY